MRLAAAALFNVHLVGVPDPVKSQAVVWVYPWFSESPEGNAVATAAPAADGIYRLAAPRSGRYLAVGVAEGFAPAWARVDVDMDGPTESHSLRMSPGCRIEGEVRWRNIPEPRQIKIRAHRNVAGRVLDFPGVDLVWADGQLEVRGASCLVNEGGLYAMGSLSAGPWHVEVVDVDGPVRVLRDVLARTRRTVEAPSASADIELVASQMQVEVRREGQSNDDVELTIVGVDGKETLRFSNDQIVFAGSPHETYKLLVNEGVYEAVELQLRAPPAGGLLRDSLILVPRVRTRGVVISLRDAKGRPITAAGLRISRLANQEGEPGIVRDLQAKDGRYRIGSLDAGRHRIEVRAGGAWYGTGSHYIEQSEEIDVPKNGELLVDMRVRVGGRLQVSARDTSGALIAAACRVYSSSGAQLPVVFVASQLGDVVRSTQTLNVEVPSSVVPALQEGRYRVQFSADGYSTVSREVDVVAGRTAVLDVVLPDGR